MSRYPTWDLTAGASSLNARREEIITLVRAGESVTEISRRFGTRNTNVARWLKANGEYDRLVKCQLDDCSAQFLFRPGKLYCCRTHTKRADARNQYAKPENALKNLARNAVRSAVRSGSLARPALCDRCGEQPKRGCDGRTLLQADHYAGYEPKYQLTVQWLCHDCDREIETLRKGRDDRRICVGERVGAWDVLEDNPATRRSVAKLRCRCACGTETLVNERHLLNRQSLKCVTCRQAETRRDDVH